jgi:L-ribulose-5-phosphate 3-epimerase
MPTIPDPGQIMLGIYEKALPPHLDWPQRLAAAARAGFGFIEMSIDESDERMARLDWTCAERARLQEAVASEGLPVTSMCLSAHRRFPMGSATPEIRQRGLDIMQKAVQLAQDTGVRIVLVPGYDVFYEPSTEETRAHLLDGLWKALEWASSAGVMLAFENTERSIISISQAMWYVSQLNSPWFQLYGDVGNLVAHGLDVLAELEAGAGHLAGIHIKDSVKGEFRNIPLGRGAVPFVEVFRKLWSLGFHGPIMLEMWDNEKPANDRLETIIAAREWVQARVVESVQPLSMPGEK